MWFLTDAQKSKPRISPKQPSASPCLLATPPWLSCLQNCHVKKESNSPSSPFCIPNFSPPPFLNFVHPPSNHLQVSVSSGFPSALLFIFSHSPSHDGSTKITQSFFYSVSCVLPPPWRTLSSPRPRGCISLLTSFLKDFCSSVLPAWWQNINFLSHVTPML